MKNTLLLLAIAGILVAGCASDPRTAAEKHKITKVTIERHVAAPKMRFGFKLDQTENDIDTSANLIANGVSIEEISRMAAMMQNHNINVPEIVREKFTAAAQNLGFEVTDANPDAVFVLRIEQYGFDTPLNAIVHGHKVPFAVVVAELRNRDGKVYWHGRTSALDVCTGPGATWKEYEEDPEKLRADWEKVIENSIRSVLRAAKT